MQTKLMQNTMAISPTSPSESSTLALSAKEADIMLPGTQRQSCREADPVPSVAEFAKHATHELSPTKDLYSPRAQAAHAPVLL